MALRVVDPGVRAEVQDLGRRGYQRHGLSVSGAADKYSLLCGNLLLGNPPGSAAIEATLFGLHVVMEQDCDVVVTGADLGLHVNGRRAPTWTLLQLKAGDAIRMAGGPYGCRAYLCVRGGIDVPEAFGSRATDPVVGIGGWKGRPLQAGDVLPIGRAGANGGRRTRWLHPDCVPEYSRQVEVRVILGPQAHRFPSDAVETLLSQPYTVTPRSDHMGCQLEGPRLTHLETADLLSECISEGSIQVPASGQPIILLAGRRGVGGYTKIATVITVDIPKVAQARPGDTLRFTAVSVEEAQALLFDQRRFFRIARLWGELG
ncbi:biotin-dependent carboxyltransferase family protein [Alicyclobacillus macrosporangiidus]|uniref:5-oxoprolinase subunit C family protein n=1 Tax=Alicyclobacillus macrosporangiidus TaxID=392015 RepID=UPI00068EA1C5|nr:biotin-dependent carboxyltransferase family protein [Alicyclobacillus macrosporangiidus]